MELLSGGVVAGIVCRHSIAPRLERDRDGVTDATRPSCHQRDTSHNLPPSNFSVVGIGLI
jgi:hypothetical protein